MAKYIDLVRTISVIIFSLICVKFSVSQTSFYVDPAFNGTRNGNASSPWQSLSDNVSPAPWSVINSALASGPVTVYFSAKSGSSNVVTTTPIDIARTDNGTNMLTLDGISKYNTSESAPSWTTNVTPTPSNWLTANKFQVGSASKGVNLPLASNASNTNCQGYITIQGFRVYRSEGQIMNLTYIHDLTLQYTESSALSGGTYGPGVYVGPANNGPCKNGNTFSGPDNVTVQYNYIHDTYEDCLYDGASTPDPPGYPSSEYNSLGLTCTTNCSTGANHVIQYNTIESCSKAGGVENVGINVKDGHTNLKVIGNTLRPTKDGFSSSAVGPAINLESGGLIENNYIEAPATVGIAPQLGWNTITSRQSLEIINNIVVNVNSGIGENTGIQVFGPNPGVSSAAFWQSVHIYNNSIFNAGMNAGSSCISVDSGNNSGVAVVENNIMQSCGAVGLSGGSTISLHDYNDYYNAGSCVSESHGICTNPQFVSTNTPYSDVNFALQSASPAIGTGINLNSAFSTDYMGATRTVPWDMGAIGGTTSNLPNPPTALVVTVN